jgi:hypothetical protein
MLFVMYIEILIYAILNQLEPMCICIWTEVFIERAGQKLSELLIWNVNFRCKYYLFCILDWLDYVSL